MNAKVVLVAAILCSAFLLSSATLSNIVAKFENPKNKDFDYFLLALSWPGSICRSLHPCHIPAGQTDNFTMHGLWPDNFDGSYPQDCDSPAGKFDPAQIQSLLPDLNKYWTDFKNDAPNFWAHEWDKHGTCASVLPSVNTQFKYFNTTMTTLRNLAITGAMIRGGIAPGPKKYAMDDVQKVFMKELGGGPAITCEKDGTVKEVRFCLNKSDFKVFDCKHKMAENSCPSVIFPTIKH